jgi:predicted glycoside hydrolase/deacetylase ChbG (UPF0249 family)
VKRLIVTADDVGLHEGMTLGAVRAHREGIVTACSVAPNGRTFDHAVELLRGCPALDVGVHLTLVEGRPICPPDRVPSLVTTDGRLMNGYRRFVARYVLGRVAVADVELELRTQIERVMEAGLALCHLNGHQHLHVLPRIFDVVVRLAGAYGIPYVRILDDRVPADVPLGRRAAVAGLSRLGRRARSRAAAHGLRTNRATIGVAGAGHLDTARLIRLLGRVDDLTELVAHPGMDDSSIGQSYGWHYDWDAETAALSAPEVREALAREGIALSGVRGCCQ